MQTRISRIAIGVQAVLWLAGCQSLQREDRVALQMAPVQNVRHGAQQPEALYALGRYYQGQINYDGAITSYRGVLESVPHHAEARNALGMVLAAQGKYDLAIAELVQAAMDAPDSARIRNNLGYAHLLRGDHAKATAIFEAAAKLDPANPRVQENLRLALATAESSCPRPAGPVPPIRTGTTVVKSDSAISPAPAPVPSGGMQLTAVAPNVYSLAPTTPSAAIESAPSTAIEIAPSAVVVHRVRLEVSNGNGIVGMARRTSHQLQDVGYAKARLTNERPYQLATTEIQYRPGFEAQARELQTALRPMLPVVASSRLRSDVHLRLALGKDAKSTLEVLVQGKPSTQTLANTARQSDNSPG